MAVTMSPGQASVTEKQPVKRINKDDKAKVDDYLRGMYDCLKERSFGTFKQLRDKCANETGVEISTSTVRRFVMVILNDPPQKCAEKAKEIADEDVKLLLETEADPVISEFMEK